MKRLVVDASTLVSGVASRSGGGAPWLILTAIVSSNTIGATGMSKRGIRMGRVSPAFVDAYKEMKDRRVTVDELVDMVAAATWIKEQLERRG